MADVSSADVLAHFQKVKGALELGQAQVEGLVQFIKDRIVINEVSAKSFTKLSKMTMSIDGKYDAAVTSPCPRAPPEAPAEFVISISTCVLIRCRKSD